MVIISTSGRFSLEAHTVVEATDFHNSEFLGQQLSQHTQSGKSCTRERRHQGSYLGIERRGWRLQFHDNIQ